MADVVTRAPGTARSGLAPSGWLLAARQLRFWLTNYRRTWRGSIYSSVLNPVLFLGAIGLAVLAYGSGAMWALVLFAILFSFGDGINSVTWALVGDYFGRRHFATIRGWISMLQSVASIPGAVFTGWVYDRTQSYTVALLVFIVCYGASGVLLWLIPSPRRDAVKPREILTIRP